MKTAARRVVCGLSASLLLAAPAAAEVVDVPTADGGSWQMMIAPQGAKFDYPASLRVAMQDVSQKEKAVPDPLAIPEPPSADSKSADDPEEKSSEAEAPMPKVEPKTDPSTKSDAPAAKDDPKAKAPKAAPAPMPLPDAASSDPVTHTPPPAPQTLHAGEPSHFGMTILPQGSSASASDRAKEYAAVYRSIPFNRAEYVANPGYRHDATMELLTGSPRLTAGHTGKTLALPKPGVYRPYLPTRREYLTAPFPYFGGAGFSGVGYGGIGNGGYSYNGPAALGLGSLGYNGYVNPVIGGGFFGTGLFGNGFIGGRGFGRGAFVPGVGPRPAGRPAAPPMTPGMNGGMGQPVMPMPAD